MRRIALLLPLAALACATTAPPPAPTPPAPPPAPAAPSLAPPPAAEGIDPAIVDRTVRPCDDFYQFACGGWIARTEIPDDQSRWVRSFNVMREENKARLRALLEEAAAGKADPQDRDGQKAADLWAACMDEAAVERAGPGRLQAEWRKLDAVRDRATLAAAVGRLQAEGLSPLFFVTSDQDAKDSNQVVGLLWQGGLTLPDRDLYLSADPHAERVRQALAAHVEKMLGLAGVPAAQAAREAREIVALETRMAESHWTRVEARDSERVYNRLDLAGLEKAAPRFDWKAWLAALGAPGVTAWNVSTPKAVSRLDELVREVKPAAWRAYLRWQVLRDAADSRALPRALSEEAFWFQARSFTGAKAMPERWKHCVDVTDALLGEALGRAFVRRHFGGEAKKKALELVTGVQAAMGRDLETLPWMDEPTRAKAREKLGAVVNKIAYPDRWRDYGPVVIRRDDFWGSAASASAFEVRRQLDEIGKPPDRTEWGMTPPTVNAYYNAGMNEMVFPAGILQPPFYVQGANEAVNHGAIGFVVGHELTHGFDDEGRKYDARGNLTDWWSPAVGEEFERRARCLVEQYGGFVAVDDVKVNGELTLGENIADLGGLELAFAAYRASREGKLPEAPVGGFSAEQQFFLAAAQAWCSKIRPENARLRALTDPHSPARWRVNGPLASLPEFAEAFACKAGDPMVKAPRCEVW
ncbi:MAG TPA: M13 family metallopeptidase [Anaeromyxobacteraceae bacterium]|nr:M13 family metallopeptidase [Anaeromyxobacteraceae bacterium]